MSFLDEVVDHLTKNFVCNARVTYMSLPAALYLDETTIPSPNPYVFANPTLVTWWHEQLSADTNFKIGICWEADLHNDESRLPVARRSIPLELLAQLGTIPGVSLYSLQTYDHNEACHADGIDGLVYTFTFPIDTEHGAFMDTAALMINMDLVISVDTAIAHLAGALGKTIFMLHPYATDWRWIAHRTTSPWYPTMRIFKQSKPFDWKTPLKQVYDRVELLALQKGTIN